MNRKNFAVLGLGSNLGRKSANLCSAVKKINSFNKIEKVSPIYKTQSLLKDDQDSYFNLCMSIYTSMEPHELLSALKQIEKSMGRESTGKWYTRILDIDIIDFNNTVYKSENLSIPHPHMAERSFVLYPLKDILPEYRHPISCLSIEHMVNNIKDDLGIKMIGEAVWR